MDSSRHASSRRSSTTTTTTTTTSASSTPRTVSAIVAAAAAKQLHHPHDTDTPEKDSSTPSSLLEARKKRIVELSMAEIGRQLDTWLKSGDLQGSALAAASGRLARGLKRRRSAEAVAGDAVEGGAGAGVGSMAEKKRAKRDPGEPLGPGKKWACPFARHDPERYAGVKTCCGPGWTDVHRVKEHLYRSHSLKHACPRCFEFFKDANGLNDHQRASTQCPVSNDVPTDVITDKQEALLRKRARSGAPEQEKWENMYTIVFPKEKTIPSPFYDTPSTTTATTTTTAGTTPAAAAETKPAAATPARSSAAPTPSRFTFEKVEEYKAFFRREFLRSVRPVLEAEVEKALATVEMQVKQKANDLMQAMQTKVTRTWQWQAQAEPTPEPEPVEFLGGLAGGAGPAYDDFGQVVDSLVEDDMFAFMDPGAGFPWDPFMPGGEAAECGVEVEGCCVGSVGRDSAYFTGGLDGVGSESWETTRSGV